MSLRGWQRPVVRALMGKKGRALPDWLLRRVARIEIPRNAPRPDLIVSSGGKSVVAARTWAMKFGAPYLFIGERKPYPADWFHTVISHVKKESSPNSIDVELIPTPVTPALIAQLGSVERGTWCMVVGGSSRSHRFCDQDWLALAHGMNALARRENIRWLLTTSRRTGTAVEGILKKHLDPLVLQDAIWWSENPRRELYKFMARSELLFVTQDSVTMVTEGVSSGRPVVAVRPQGLRLSEDSFLPVYFDLLERNGRITRLETGALSSFSPKCVEFNLLARNALDGAVNEVIRRLSWA
jgi:mitochondrial fission protein ELM1